MQTVKEDVDRTRHGAQSVLVIGAGGYIGSAVVDRLLAVGHRVAGLVRRDSAAQELRSRGAAPIIGDLEDLQPVIDRFRDFDAVIYIAQLMLAPEREAIERMVAALHGSGKAFVFTSGTGVLSERTDGDWSEHTFAEDDEFVPSKYIGGRKDTEDLVRRGAEHGVRGMVVRPAMVWGRGGCPQLRSMAAATGSTGAVCYIGRGLNLYSSVHVDDLADVYARAIDAGVPGALYHAVSGETNFRTMAQALAQQLGVPTRSVDLSEAIDIWGKFIALVTLATCSRSMARRSREELGWAPHPGRLDILDDVVNYPLAEAAR